VISVLLDDGGRPAIDGEELERAVRLACESQGASEGEVSVALLDDAAIGSLHEAHLHQEGPTDVLAFALYDEGEPVVGDVYVGIEQAARQAEELGVSLREELVRLVVHGTLHVLGLDHPEEAAARDESPMYRTQESLVRAVIGGSPP
jgi:probable rRNA maturation factor